MTDQPQPSIGTVAEEAARLISAVAMMSRPSTDATHDRSPYAGEPAQDPASPETEHASRPGDTTPPHQASSAGAPEGDQSPSAAHSCSSCGCEVGGTPVACKLCPLCQGIALLRSVRPETVDRLADLASAVATTLRDMASQSRASDPGSGSGPGARSAPDGPTVQDIRVEEEGEE